MFVYVVVGLWLLTVQAVLVTGNTNPEICSACVIVVGLVQQAELSVRFENILKSRCPDGRVAQPACFAGIDELVLALEAKAVPEDICLSAGLCTNPECKLFKTWPVKDLPDPLPDWPTTRHRHTLEEDQKTIYINRHGEKKWSLGCLNDQGQARAAYIATNVYNGENFLAPDAIFACQYDDPIDCERCKETVTPLSEKTGLPIVFDYGYRLVLGGNKGAAKAMKEKLKTADTIVVAWEHNNINPLTEAIGVDSSLLESWPDSDYDTIYTLKFDAESLELLSFTKSAEGFNGGDEKKVGESAMKSVTKTLFIDMLDALTWNAYSSPEDSGLPKIALPYLAVANLKALASGNLDDNECGRFNVTCRIDAFANYHEPLADRDGDVFSPEGKGVLRGTHWRGVDCDDKDETIHPGVSGKEEKASGEDVNCNGIAGGNETGSFESIFCDESDSRGVIILGDSATAHFHVPPDWLTAKSLDFDDVLPKVLDELDYPQCSWGTGHADLEECPYQHPVPGIDGVFSIYEGMRQRNRCNTNDYQNIGVNGARITASMNLAKSLQRDTVRDKPALVWLSLMGNDVCNGHVGFDHMTTPETYYDKAIETLKVLDTKLPPGSFVVTPGMFDGVLLYDTMHAQQHPLGTTYEALYDFMNCLEESPCWGWLNSDASVRRKTQEIANSLNEVSRKLEEEEFENFKFLFYEVPWKQMFAEYSKSGEPVTNLIEKVDGFHPSQAGNALFAQNFFGWLEREHEESLGGLNPYNEEIDSIFFN
ncbi:hypothetical protein TrRE_jg10234 [Triparma retinervis]|uniref:SGNH hydrolase-type esterase domain-containing protein n=1 Tax=Triparma retinervis TaxID=2557542 RepID=A0A9W6ZJH9_9STRA|nr:hypothetical protein TrRE_jg10234 [Triparma retinervis]